MTAFSGALKLALLGLLVNLTVVHGNIDVAPSNRMVVAGKRMEMECRSRNGTKVREWKLQRISESEILKVLTNWGSVRIGQNFSHFGVNVDENGSGLIYINSTRTRDAGIYTCSVQEKQTTEYSAYLIVLDKEQICETNIFPNSSAKERNNRWFQCSIHLGMYWEPNVEWTQECITGSDEYTNEEGAICHGIESNVTTGSTVTHRLTLTADYYNYTCSVLCTIFFKWTNWSKEAAGSATANNTPSYTYIWNLSDSKSSLQKDNTTNAVVIAEDNDGTHPGGVMQPVIIVVITVVILVAIVCIACCLCCSCYKRKVADLLLNLVGFLQGGNPKIVRIPNKDVHQTTLAVSQKANLRIIKEREEQEDSRGAGANHDSVYSIKSRSVHFPEPKGARPSATDSIYEAMTDSVCYEHIDDAQINCENETSI